LASGEAVARLDDMRRSVAKEMNRIMGAALIWVLLWAKEKQTGIRRQQGRPAYKLERCRPVGRVRIGFGREKTKKVTCTRILQLNRGSGTRLRQGRQTTKESTKRLYFYAPERY